MTNKSCVMSVILSLAGLLLATDAIYAKHGGRGGCQGRGGHGGCYGGSYCGGCYGGGYGGCHGGYTSGGHHGGGYSYGTYVPQSYGYSNGYSPNGVTSVAPSNSTANVAFYPPNGQTNGASPAIPNNAARIRVILPNPQASVWIDGQPTTSTGLVRMYHTPELTTDGSYLIKVSWTEGEREQSKERTITVNPGQTTVADFSQARIGSEESQEALPRRTQQRLPDAEK